MKHIACRMALSVVLCSAAGAAFAKNCSSSGSLSYVGRTSDASRSVWLSTIDPGNSSNFRLEAAQGSSTVDTFGPRTAGDAFRHLSLSPFVSNGNGGTHKLYDQSSGDCLLDTQNQKGGLVFPPFPSRPPVGIRPPIGILPPPGGVMPGLPGGVRPPIAVLPPTGIMPGLPGGVKPPIGTLPPSGGGGEGGGIGGGGDGLAGVGIEATSAGSDNAAAAGAPPSCTFEPEKYPDLPYCDPNAWHSAAVSTAPLTAGRDLAPPTPWNVWVDANAIRIEDDRFVIERSGDSYSVSGGIDYALSNGGVVGLQVLWNQAESEATGDRYNLTSEGLSVGPYAAISLNDQWALYGSLTWGSYDTNLELLTLDGDYDQDQIAADIILTGQYVYDNDTYLRPQFSLSYLQFDTPDHQLTGTVAGTPVSIDVSGSSSSYGTFTPTVEFGRIFLNGSTLWVPYGELGAVYEFSRPDSMGLFGADETSEWSGTIRAGLRATTEESFHADLSVGYLSGFQSGLDVIEAGVYLAWGF